MIEMKPLMRLKNATRHSKDQSARDERRAPSPTVAVRLAMCFPRGLEGNLHINRRRVEVNLQGRGTEQCGWW
jgi:hypothetical protein